MTGFKKFAHFGQFWPILKKKSLSADSYVRIFRTSPVWQKRKGPDFWSPDFKRTTVDNKIFNSFGNNLDNSYSMTPNEL